jgi:hypothetical protein
VRHSVGIQFLPACWEWYLEAFGEVLEFAVLTAEGFFAVDALGEFLDLHLVGVAVQVVALDLAEPKWRGRYLRR